VPYLPTWCIWTTCIPRSHKLVGLTCFKTFRRACLISSGHECTLYECRCPLHAGKTRRELVELERSIDEQLDSGAVPDPEYWTTVLSRLSIWQVPTQKICRTCCPQRAARQLPNGHRGPVVHHVRAWLGDDKRPLQRPHIVTHCAQARARLRELHADILARQLAAAEAGTDVRAEMGWDREEREASTSRVHPAVKVASIPCCTVLCAAARSAGLATDKWGCSHLSAVPANQGHAGHVQEQEAAATSPAAEPAAASNGQAAEPEPEPEEDEDAALERLARPPDDAGTTWTPWPRRQKIY
jgi:Conserved mid region of cactin